MQITSSPTQVTLSPTHFFQEQMTPLKNVVQCEINGWLQTSKKEKSPVKRMMGRPPRRPTAAQMSTIANLRMKRAQLLKSTPKKRDNDVQSTNPSTSSQVQSKSPVIRIENNYIPLIQISQFSIHDDDVFRQKNVIEPYKALEKATPFVKNYRDNSYKKYSLRKLRTNTHREYEQQLKNKLNILNQSIQIVKHDLTANQCKAINFISRKISNLSLKSNNDKKK